MDYYKLLGVGRNATPEELTAAYRKLAIKFHPDKNPDNPQAAAEQFKKVANAFSVLIDPNKRALYNGGRMKDRPDPDPNPKRDKPKGPFYDRKKGKWYDSIEEKEREDAFYAQMNRPLSDYTPPPPKFDIWGRRLTPEEQAQWVREQTSPGITLPPRKDVYFKDAYRDQYYGGGEPHIR